MKPPDPDLVSFLRRNLKTHGEGPLREKLLEEGVAPLEIDQAIAQARRSPARTGRLLGAVIGGALGVAVAVFVALSTKPAGPPSAPGSPAAPTDAAPSHGAPPADPNDVGRVFHGHSGFILKLPPGYDAVSDFKDPQSTIEVVYLFPKGMDPTHLVNQRLYGYLGIFKMEVQPNVTPMAAVRSQVTAALNSRRVNFEEKTVEAGGMQALIIAAKEPFPMTQAYVRGARVLYILTAGPEEKRFNDVLQSLHEAAPGGSRP